MGFSMTFPGFSMTFAVFHDYPGLEYGLPKFHDFPGPAVTLLKALNDMLLPSFNSSVSCRMLMFQWK